jgi:hypothetical protein
MKTLGKMLDWIHVLFTLTVSVLVVVAFTARTHWKKNYAEMARRNARGAAELAAERADRRKLAALKDRAIQALSSDRDDLKTQLKLAVAQRTEAQNRGLKTQSQLQEAQAASKKIQGQLRQTQDQLHEAQANYQKVQDQLQEDQTARQKMKGLLEAREAEVRNLDECVKDMLRRTRDVIASNNELSDRATSAEAAYDSVMEELRKSVEAGQTARAAAGVPEPIEDRAKAVSVTNGPPKGNDTAPAKPRTLTGSVRGILLEGERPQPSLTVSLQTSAGASVSDTHTGFDGRFLFPAVAPGTYRLYVRKSESEPEDQITIAQEPISVQPDRAIDVTLRLSRQPAPDADTSHPQ